MSDGAGQSSCRIVSEVDSCSTSNHKHAVAPSSNGGILAHEVVFVVIGQPT